MSARNNPENKDSYIKELEGKISELLFELNEKQELLKTEQEQKEFYQFVADFAYGWELWFEPSGKIKYCSPSCLDMTGYTANQIMESVPLSELLVYSLDREKFDRFLADALNQLLASPSLEFRIMSRTRQIRWCSVNVRGVYNRQDRYMGIRASVQDITRLKKALGHINELSAGKELENRNRQRLKTELDIRERELVAFLLQLSRKNELIAMASQHIKKITEGVNKYNREKLDKLLELLDKSQKNSVDWNMVELQLERFYPGFTDRLFVRHPKLTPNDRKLAACLRLGLTSKEIAGLRNLTRQSVEIARVRLRKKLKLPRQIRLVNYLSNI
jgi:PAS domain S-box-containing protein